MIDNTCDVSTHTQQSNDASHCLRWSRDPKDLEEIKLGIFYYPICSASSTWEACIAGAVADAKNLSQMAVKFGCNNEIALKGNKIAKKFGLK